MTDAWQTGTKFVLATAAAVIIGTGSAIAVQDFRTNSGNVVGGPDSRTSVPVYRPDNASEASGKQGPVGAVVALRVLRGLIPGSGDEWHWPDGTLKGGGKRSPGAGGGDEWHWPDGTLKGGGKKNEGGGKLNQGGGKLNQGGGQQAPSGCKRC